MSIYKHQKDTRKKMEKFYFIKTLIPIFFVWQMFSMSPFVLMKRSLQPKIHKNHDVIFVLSLSIQVVVLLHGLIIYNNYIETFDEMVTLF